jgi:hypothetical protein
VDARAQQQGAGALEVSKHPGAQQQQQRGRHEASLHSGTQQLRPSGPESLLRIRVASGSEDWTPLRTIEVSQNSISLHTTSGKYVSAHEDGGVSAYLTSRGPDEIFVKVPRIPRASYLGIGTSSGFEKEDLDLDISNRLLEAFSLQSSSFGTYLRIERDGSLSAEGCDTDGAAIVFTESPNGILMNQGRVVAAVNTRLILLTTAFLPGPAYYNIHVHEIFMVLWMNVMNEIFYKVHVITESDCGELLRELVRCADEIGSKTVANKSLIRWEMMKEKLVCVPSRTGRQPNYGDFFEYANRSLAGNMVLLANGDIVFDESLRRIAPKRIMAGELAFVLGVKTPPLSSVYKTVFGTDCGPPTVSDQCSVGPWQGANAKTAGQSWDAFVFASPLPSNFAYSNEDVHMNLYGAEHVAAFAFAKSGIQLYNPCEHINAFHWHCQGQKMHPWLHNVWTDTVDHYPHHSVSNIFPCWYCPSITMPRETAKPSALCKSGTEEWHPGLANAFNLKAVKVRVCCASPGACGNMAFQWLPPCRVSSDVNCVIWENIATMRWY